MQAAMGDSIQHAREAIGSRHDPQDMQRAVSHAFGLYKRTRLPPPLPSACPWFGGWAKGLLKEGIHAMLAVKVPVIAGMGLKAQMCSWTLL